MIMIIIMRIILILIMIMRWWLRHIFLPQAIKRKLDLCESIDKS